ncbi:myosin-crossreactive antigen [Bradyrhizobium sp. BR13661]|jgi:oleate hydratase|nr:myosin-crossreactive antigen [Bradyrhizobium sp. BR13661]
MGAPDFDGAVCIPCRMPYITSMFMPRAATDRPLPVPKNSRNLALISQFVEIPDDVVFTVEYSVRAALAQPTPLSALIVCGANLDG